ncbi:hypothetical protein N0V90_008182 [Kalmusia sp. IMI 367209]|nr:hypothetical protein N0V90_008182 [Kalmusia sp. IMI 367209]
MFSKTLFITAFAAISSVISKKCGDKAQDALDALADICNDAGVEVSTKLPSTASGSASPTGTGSSSKNSGSASSTGAASPSSSGSTENAATSPSATGSSPETQPSGSAAGKLDLSAAALLASFGIVVAAL